jgi:hypothetical protein
LSWKIFVAQFCLNIFQISERQADPAEGELNPGGGDPSNSDGNPNSDPEPNTNPSNNDPGNENNNNNGQTEPPNNNSNDAETISTMPFTNPTFATPPTQFWTSKHLNLKTSQLNFICFNF